MQVLSGSGGPLCKSLRIILGRVWEGRAGIEKHAGILTFGYKKTAFSSDVSAMFELGELGYCLCQAKSFWIRKPGSILDFPRRVYLDGRSREITHGHLPSPHEYAQGICIIF